MLVKLFDQTNEAEAINIDLELLSQEMFPQ